MECVRSFFPSDLNYLINHPDILPNIIDDRASLPLDSTEIVLNPDNYLYVFNGGACLFLHEDADKYIMDVYFLARNRGPEALEAAKASLDLMSARASHIKAEVAEFNKPAQYFATSLGFKRQSVKRNARIIDGQSYSLIVYEKDMHGLPGRQHLRNIDG